MFHEGTLQSGIALAIQEQKLVACFVRDDSTTSKQWEEEWLTSGWISSLLVQKAVLLRLEAGSTEAGFLAAFCDITSPPTFVIIQNGQLQTQLKKDVSHNEFINAIRTVLGASPLPGSSTSQAPTPQASTPQPAQPPAPIQAEDDLYGDNEEPQPAPAPAQKPTPASTKGKQKAAPPTEPKPDTTPRSLTATQLAAREAVRKKKREEADELARVKARIEADKAERKAQAEARKLEREREKNDAVAQSTNTQATTTSNSTRGSQSKTVSLQVRLFDGRTIRCTFPRTASLEKEVREWIDEEFGKLDADDPNVANNKTLPPYYFRHILSPQPSRELSAGDENQTLGDIDLAPSATLVLVAVKGYTEAYDSAGSGVVGNAVGTATGLVGGAFGLLSSTIGYVGETINTIITTGRAAGAHNTQDARGHTTTSQESPSQQSQQRQQSERSGGNEGASIRVRTLADQRAREGTDQQFYNGNQLDTVPRTDDDDKRS